MSAVEWIARRQPAVNNYRHVAAVAMVTTPFSTKRWLVKRPVTCRYYKGFNTSSTLWNVRDSILTIPLCTLVRQIRAVRPLQTREACRVCQLCFCFPCNHRRAVRLVPCFLQKGYHYLSEIFVWNLVAVGCLKNRFPSYLGYPLYIIRSGIRYLQVNTERHPQRICEALGTGSTMSVDTDSGNQAPSGDGISWHCW